jgi:hypothetical protein
MVGAGAAKPDSSDVEAFRKVLLAVMSIAQIAPSGIYLQLCLRSSACVYVLPIAEPKQQVGWEST